MTAAFEFSHRTHRNIKPTALRLAALSLLLVPPAALRAGDDGPIRACYQHCCLRYVMNEKMTNQSLRDRFKLKEDKVATVSQIIAATVDAGKIKAADPAQTSNRYRNYVPFWA